MISISFITLATAAALALWVIAINRRNSVPDSPSMLLPLCLDEDLLDMTAFDYPQFLATEPTPESHCRLIEYTKPLVAECIDTWASSDDYHNTAQNNKVSILSGQHIAFIGDSRLREHYTNLITVQHLNLNRLQKKTIKIIFKRLPSNC